MDKRSCQSNIKCSVVSCEYHDSKGMCVADEIKVEKPDAVTAKETRCDTFKVKGSYSS